MNLLKCLNRLQSSFKKLKIFCFAFVQFFLLTAYVNAENNFVESEMGQQSSFKGKVLDNDNTPLIGVAVSVKGKSVKTMTDSEGGFTLRAALGDIIIFNYIGFETLEFVVNSLDPAVIKLTPTTSALNEVTVTALGIKREKKSLGYSVQEIKGEVFEKVKEPNIIASLTGQVAGLTVYNKTGTFQAPAFNIRGSSSILVVIDGVPMGTDTWSINPDDVDKIDVIKGATGAALYGAAGSNGVIMVTTKKGGNNPRGLSINFNSSTV